MVGTLLRPLSGVFNVGTKGGRGIVFMVGSEVWVKHLYDLRKKEVGDHPPTDGFVSSLHFMYQDCVEFQALAGACSRPDVA